MLHTHLGDTWGDTWVTVSGPLRRLACDALPHRSLLLPFKGYGMLIVPSCSPGVRCGHVANGPRGSNICEHEVDWTDTCTP